jgi:hypothetical protein
VRFDPDKESRVLKLGFSSIESPSPGETRVTVSFVSDLSVVLTPSKVVFSDPFSCRCSSILSEIPGSQLSEVLWDNPRS